MGRGRGSGHGRGQLAEPAAVAALLGGQATLSQVAERIEALSGDTLHYSDNDLAGVLMLLEREGVAEGTIVRQGPHAERAWTLTPAGLERTGQAADELRTRALGMLNIADALEVLQDENLLH